jgi:hypothetical protein
MVEYIDSLFSGVGEYVLSMGLERVCHIITADTYDDRHKLLHKGNNREEGEPLRKDVFFYQDLPAASPEYNGSYVLSELTQEERNTYLKSPFFNDPDCGPAEIWWRVHQSEMPNNIVGVSRNERHRRWGYVLWDASRLENIGRLEEPGPEVMDVLVEYKNKRPSLKNSWEMREKIWRAGGTGWWSPEDRSEVTRPPHCNQGVSSVDEAKKLLRAMELPIV